METVITSRIEAGLIELLLSLFIRLEDSCRLHVVILDLDEKVHRSPKMFPHMATMPYLLMSTPSLFPSPETRLEIGTTTLDTPRVMEPVSREVGLSRLVPLTDVCKARGEDGLGTEVANIVLAVTGLDGECADDVFDANVSDEHDSGSILMADLLSGSQMDPIVSQLMAWHSLTVL